MSHRVWSLKPPQTARLHAFRKNAFTQRSVPHLTRTQQTAAAPHSRPVEYEHTDGKASMAAVSVDPFRVVGKELKFLTGNIQQLLGSGHPILDTVAKYYTSSEGKYIRPLLVLLMSQATAPNSSNNPNARRSSTASSKINESISPTSVLADVNPFLPSNPLFPSALPSNNPFQDLLSTSAPTNGSSPSILPSQRRLAEITELIHTASLLHDDVIDLSLSRRGSPSANHSFGNKMAVLAGDFLLGRASVSLARLRDPEVTELLATVIANLVEGEFMQLKNTAMDESRPVWKPEVMDYYLQKTYLKSASLISKSCRAAALLGGAEAEVVEAAYGYGRNLGLAFQLVDDLLDYTAVAGTSNSTANNNNNNSPFTKNDNNQQLGKPAGADLELGLATAPLIFAWEKNPQLGELVGRKFSQKGDVELARRLVAESEGVERTRDLAQGYADRARGCLRVVGEGEAKRGLEGMCRRVMERKK